MARATGATHSEIKHRWREGVNNSKKENKYSKIILVQVNIIFALPDYSSEVVERHQNLFYGRLTNLAL